MEPVTTLSSTFRFYGVELTILSPDISSYKNEANNYVKEERKRKIGRKESDHKLTVADLEKNALL